MQTENKTQFLGEIDQYNTVSLNLFRIQHHVTVHRSACAETNQVIRSLITKKHRSAVTGRRQPYLAGRSCRFVFGKQRN